MTVNLNVFLAQRLGIGLDSRLAFRHAVGFARGVDGFDLLDVLVNFRHGLGDRPSLALTEEQKNNAANERKDQDGDKDNIF